MPARRLLPRLVAATTLLAGLALLGAGCSLLADEAEVSGACGRALHRAEVVAATRSRALARTVAATDVDPEQVTATLARRPVAQRALLGPVATTSSRAAREGQALRRLVARCETGEAPPPASCRRAVDLAVRASQRSATALDERLDQWDEQLAIADHATAGEVAATRAAVDRWAEAEARARRTALQADRSLVRQVEAATACRTALA